MKTRIISAAVIIPVALVVLLLLEPYVLTVLLAVIGAIGAYELINAVNMSFTAGSDKKESEDTPSPRVAVYAIIAAVMVPFVVYIYFAFGIPMTAGMLIVFFIPICLLMIDFFLSFSRSRPAALTGKPDTEKPAGQRLRLRQVLVVPAAAMLVPFMLSCLIGLRVPETVYSDAHDEGTQLGRIFVMLPIIVTVFTDSGAYFTGKAIGKHKPLPKISPNKTVEGFIGGIVFGVAVMPIYGLIISTATDLSVSFPLLLLYGFSGAVITEVGDLAFSLVKRKCGIKDYGKLIPGHGGVLDRFDSLSFSAPLMLLLVSALPFVK